MKRELNRKKNKEREALNIEEDKKNFGQRQNGCNRLETMVYASEWVSAPRVLVQL